jgi:acetate kinase
MRLARGSFLGAKLDDGGNAQGVPGQDIATPDSAVRVLTIRAQEDWAIARECWRLMRTSPGCGCSANV